MAQASESKPRLKVLLVEDDEVQVTFIQHVIEEIDGFEIYGLARDGQDAMHWLQEQSAAGADSLPDVILCDINMPLMNGFEVLQAVKADAVLKRIPFVMLTTSSSEEDIDRSYLDGAATFITKPGGIPNLATTLQRFTDYWRVATYRPASLSGFLLETAAAMREAEFDDSQLLRFVNVLVVEDDPVQARMIEEVINGNYLLRHVGTLDTGEAAIELLREKTASFHADGPNLVLCDILLPGCSGIDVLRSVRADENQRTIPVVMLTGTRDEADVARCYEEGAATFLSKPVTPDELVAVIRMLSRYWTDQGVRLPWK